MIITSHFIATRIARLTTAEAADDDEDEERTKSNDEWKTETDSSRQSSQSCSDDSPQMFLNESLND